MGLFTAGQPLTAAQLNSINGFVQKTADQSVTSSTVLVNDTQLAYTLSTTGQYVFKIVLFVASNANAAGDMQVAMSFPAGNCFWGAIALDSAIASGTIASLDAGALAPATSGVSVHVAGLSTTNTMVLIEGTCFASSTGTLRLMWAQFASNANASIVRAGSYMRVQQVA